MDYYSILGITKNASQDEIRKAYKKQSMQHHPDRGGDEEQFKKVNEAYSILKDPAKRQQYDNPQPRMDSSFFNQNFGGNYEDIFASMFGGAFRPPRQPRNADIRIKVTINLEEVFDGKKIIASYKLRSGREENVNLDIPPGANDGDTIRFGGLGDDSIQGRRGDLYVIIAVNHNPYWSRSGDDLTITRRVNCLELILGTKIKIMTLDRRTLELNIPEGTRNNTTFSMNGYGIPNMRSGRRGNIFVKIEAEIPKGLSKEKLEKIKEVINGS